MTATSEQEPSALYDVPGPKARKRHRIFGVLATLAIAAILGWILYLLFDTDQFTDRKSVV